MKISYFREKAHWLTVTCLVEKDDGDFDCFTYNGILDKTQVYTGEEKKSMISRLLSYDFCDSRWVKIAENELSKGELFELQTICNNIKG